jgi:hypothetical protein
VQYHFNVVAEGGAQEQIEARKTPNPYVVAEAIFDFFGSADNQFPGNPAIVEFLPVEFDAELVTRSVLSRNDVLSQVCEASGERLGIFV